MECKIKTSKNVTNSRNAETHYNNCTQRSFAKPPNMFLATDQVD